MAQTKKKSKRGRNNNNDDSAAIMKMRKQLMKLSKKDFIKKCKQYHIKFDGNKTKTVNQLITKMTLSSTDNHNNNTSNQAKKRKNKTSTNKEIKQPKQPHTLIYTKPLHKQNKKQIKRNDKKKKKKTKLSKSKDSKKQQQQKQQIQQQQQPLLLIQSETTLSNELIYLRCNKDEKSLTVSCGNKKFIIKCHPTDNISSDLNKKISKRLYKKFGLERFRNKYITDKFRWVNETSYNIYNPTPLCSTTTVNMLNKKRVYRLQDAIKINIKYEDYDETDVWYQFENDNFTKQFIEYADVVPSDVVMYFNKDGNNENANDNDIDDFAATIDDYDVEKKQEINMWSNGRSVGIYDNCWMNITHKQIARENTKINVKTVEGKLLKYDININWKVFDLMCLIQIIEDITWRKQRIVAKGKQLKPAWVLSEHGVVDNDTVQLVLR